MLTSPDKAILRRITKKAASHYIDNYTRADSSDKAWIELHVAEQLVPGQNEAYNPPERLFCISMFMVGCPIALLSHIYGVSRQSIHAKITRFRELTAMSHITRENNFPLDKTDQFIILPICKDLFDQLMKQDHRGAFGRLDPTMIGSIILSKAYERMREDNTEILAEPARMELPEAPQPAPKEPKKHTFAPLTAAEILAQARKPTTDSNLNKEEPTPLAPLTEERTPDQDAPVPREQQQALDALFGQ